MQVTVTKDGQEFTSEVACPSIPHELMAFAASIIGMVNQGIAVRISPEAGVHIKELEKRITDAIKFDAIKDQTVPCKVESVAPLYYIKHTSTGAYYREKRPISILCGEPGDNWEVTNNFSYASPFSSRESAQKCIAKTTGKGYKVVTADEVRKT